MCVCTFMLFRGKVGLRTLQQCLLFVEEICLSPFMCVYIYICTYARIPCMQMSNGDRWNRAIDITTVAASKSGSLSVINIDSGNPSSQPERNILSLMRYFFQTSISDWHLFPSSSLTRSSFSVLLFISSLSSLPNRNMLLSALHYFYFTYRVPRFPIPHFIFYASSSEDNASRATSISFGRMIVCNS